MLQAVQGRKTTANKKYTDGTLGVRRIGTAETYFFKTLHLCGSKTPKHATPKIGRPKLQNIVF